GEHFGAERLECPRQLARLLARARHDDTPSRKGVATRLGCHAWLQSLGTQIHYQAMLRALRSALVRFTVRRAAASQRDAPRRADRHAEASARFARAYAAGCGADALWLNARALFQAGDVKAADEALHLWATQVPDGLERLSDARAELFADKRDG